jgi:hypothetical protein
MQEGDVVEFRAIGPHGWVGKGTVHAIHVIQTADGQLVPAILLHLLPGEAHNNEGVVATEQQGIVIGEGELA